MISFILKILLKFATKHATYDYDKSVLIQVMAWCQTSTKPLSDSLLTQIYQ